MVQFVLVALFTLFLSACESNPPAPVADRLPQPTKPNPSAKPEINNQNGTKTVNGKDWRPDTHIVQKGDTLFSIGLEYGFEYKDIAAANNISEPYPIKIGQKLNLAGLKSKSENADQNQAVATATENGVVITPINTDSAVIESTVTEAKPAETAAPESAVTPILSEPKSLREPYSPEAFNKPVVIKITETKVLAPSKPIDAKPLESKSSVATPTNDEAITWIWPTQGKVIANFNEATNKGLDIGGSAGQAINASSSGKVIYSGSDLRGYGKLVIIKHNKTYLSVYAHNSKILVKEGQVVAAGQKIAEMGDTDASRIKLHFEIRRLGKSVDPAQYLNQN